MLPEKTKTPAFEAELDIPSLISITSDFLLCRLVVKAKANHLHQYVRHDAQWTQEPLQCQTFERLWSINQPKEKQSIIEGRQGDMAKLCRCMGSEHQLS